MKKILIYSFLLLTIGMFSCTNNLSEDPSYSLEEQIDFKMQNFNIVSVSPSNTVNLMAKWKELIPADEVDPGEVMLDFKQIRIAKFSDQSYGLYGFTADDSGNLSSVSYIDVTYDSKDLFIIPEKNDRFTDTGSTITCYNCGSIGPLSVDDCVPKKDPATGKSYCTECKNSTNPDSQCKKKVTQSTD